MDQKQRAVKSRLQIVRTRRSRKSNTSVGGDSESLSRISDSEVFKYFNNEKETRYKRIIWEAMNKDYLEANKQKRAKTYKKAGSIIKVAKPPHGVDNEKRLSSKINYDMLKKQNREEGVDKMLDGEDMNSQRIDMHPKNEKLNSEARSSGNNTDDEFGYGDTGCQEGDIIQDYYGIGEDCGYDEEYYYEEN